MASVKITPPTGMLFTPGQLNAGAQLESICQDHGVLCVAGYAGTGKSVLLSCLYNQLEALGIPCEVVCPTGRAAARLRALGVPAKTIHSWMYIPVVDPLSKQLVSFRRRMDVDVPARFVLLVDESSMVGPTVASDLVQVVHPEEKGHSQILFGDHFQLPPILSQQEAKEHGSDFCLLNSAYAAKMHYGFSELTDVVRQASESPVLRLATALRKEERAPKQDRDRVEILSAPRSLFEERLKHCDWGSDVSAAALTWRNIDRQELNDIVRKARGFSAAIEVGDRLVNLLNHRRAELCNGDLLDVLSVAEAFHHGGIPLYRIRCSGPLGEVEQLALLASREGGSGESFALAQQLKKGLGEMPLVVDYGYVLTVHKAQGCEYQQVSVYAPGGLYDVMGVSQGNRWLYTAVTRASERFTFIGSGSLASRLGG